MIESNPSAPKFKCQVKIQKEGLPIRPIVSFINAPSYKLSKDISKIVKETYQYGEKYSVKNSIQLIEKLKKVVVTENMNLISLDVKDKFTSIKVEKAINLLESSLLTLEVTRTRTKC